jgi:hypothetical protein
VQFREGSTVQYSSIPKLHYSGLLQHARAPLFFTVNRYGDLFLGKGACKRRSLPQLGRLLGFGSHDGDDAINGIFFEESPPLPPKGGRRGRPVSDVPLQIAPRQGENRLGVFQCAVVVISGVRLRRRGSSGKARPGSIAEPYVTEEQRRQWAHAASTLRAGVFPTDAGSLRR